MESMALWRWKWMNMLGTKSPNSFPVGGFIRRRHSSAGTREEFRAPFASATPKLGPGRGDEWHKMPKNIKDLYRLTTSNKLCTNIIQRQKHSDWQLECTWGAAWLQTLLLAKSSHHPSLNCRSQKIYTENETMIYIYKCIMQPVSSWTGRVISARPENSGCFQILSTLFSK